MAPWEGDSKDLKLEESVDFLEMLAFSKIKDVRSVVTKQQGKLFPDDFERTQQEAFEKTRREAIDNLKRRADNPFFKFFGFGSAGGSASPDSLEAKFSPYRAKKEERMVARRKEYEHIRGLMQKQLEAELEKEKAFYAEHKMPLWDLFSKGPPSPPPPSIPGAGATDQA
jgi:hypothetical protein